MEMNNANDNVKKMCVSRSGIMRKVLFPLPNARNRNNNKKEADPNNNKRKLK